MEGSTSESGIPKELGHGSLLLPIDSINELRQLKGSAIVVDTLGVDEAVLIVVSLLVSDPNLKLCVMEITSSFI